MRKRIIRIIICYIILIFCIWLLISLFNKEDKKSTSTINVSVTLFPEYDFVKKIGGDKITVNLLIDAGIESHTYEPSVRDMRNINDSDLFIYTGDSMEPWAKKIIDSIDSDCKILNCSKNIELIEIDSFFEEYGILDEEEHDEHSEHSYEYDGHIWLDPQNAIVMIDVICNELVEIDPKNKEYYIKNAEAYKKELKKLDEDIENQIEKLKVDTLVFGGEFSYAYFMKRYNLKVVSTYTSCGEGAEPSVSRIKEVIDYINNNNIKAVFYEDLSEGTVAKMISEETNAKPVVFYSVHNVSNEQLKNGESYVTIMRKNLENLKGLF